MTSDKEDTKARTQPEQYRMIPLLIWAYHLIRKRFFSVKYEDLTANTTLKNYGDIDCLKIENVIDPPNEDGEMPIIQPSLYFSLSQMSNELKIQ